MTFKGSLRYWLPVFLWMAFIFWMSTGAFSAQNTSRILEPVIRFLFPDLPAHTLKALHGLVRKFGHVAEYLVLGLLLFRAFCFSSTEPRPLRCALYSLLVVVISAAGDELHQSFVSTRTASVFDVLIDTTGGILGQAASALWYGRSRG